MSQLMFVSISLRDKKVLEKIRVGVSFKSPLVSISLRDKSIRKVCNDVTSYIHQVSISLRDKHIGKIMAERELSRYKKFQSPYGIKVLERTERRVQRGESCVSISLRDKSIRKICYPMISTIIFVSISLRDKSIRKRPCRANCNPMKCFNLPTG